MCIVLNSEGMCVCVNLTACVWTVQCVPRTCVCGVCGEKAGAGVDLTVTINDIHIIDDVSR